MITLAIIIALSFVLLFWRLCTSAGLSGTETGGLLDVRLQTHCGKWIDRKP